MKAAPFEYVKPASLAEACSILAADEDARPISGGQTLVPMMAMRLARPTKLVDLARLPELGGITREGNDLILGAAVRQAVAERSGDIAEHVPLLATALPWVGHHPTRNRGTVGGSVANADPAAEIPLVLVTLGGTIHTTSTTGERKIPARDFFEGLMATALEDGELVTALSFPIWQDGRIGTGFHEISARKSDFAYVSAAAQVAVDTNGVCTRCVIGLGSAAPAPAFLAAVSGKVSAGSTDAADLDAALAQDIAALDVMTDSHATEPYRRRVAHSLAKRALADALAQARKSQ